MIIPRVVSPLRRAAGIDSDFWISVFGCYTTSQLVLSQSALISRDEITTGGRMSRMLHDIMALVKKRLMSASKGGYSIEGKVACLGCRYIISSHQA